MMYGIGRRFSTFLSIHTVKRQTFCRLDISGRDVRSRASSWRTPSWKAKLQTHAQSAWTCEPLRCNTLLFVFEKTKSIKHPPLLCRKNEILRDLGADLQHRGLDDLCTSCREAQGERCTVQRLRSGLESHLQAASSNKGKKAVFCVLRTPSLQDSTIHAEILKAHNFQ